ncbi:hypothetical protein GCM10010466_29500 [Planomonospora alba]|uniref:DUF2637 domain-containing protein n=1 Tax=Planomonospora alba TaxID=161354 RepID=A0ABP6N534_9ACTN
METVSILPRHVEREKKWAVTVGLAAALSPNVIGQWNLAVAIGWNPYLAAALPLASELYATMAARVWSAIPKHHKAAKRAAAWNMVAGVVLSFALNGVAEAVKHGALSVSLPLVLGVAAVPTICVAFLLHMAMSGDVPASVHQDQDQPAETETERPVYTEQEGGTETEPEPPAETEEKPKKASTVRVSPANVAKAKTFLLSVPDPERVTGTDLADILPRLSPRSRRAALDKARAELAAETAQGTLDLVA